MLNLSPYLLRNSAPLRRLAGTAAIALAVLAGVATQAAIPPAPALIEGRYSDEPTYEQSAAAPLDLSSFWLE
jgi:hypothetical protein